MMKKNCCIKHIVYIGFIIFFVFNFQQLHSQKIRLLTPDDGLSNSHINQIYQDSKGYIWIATENGLNRFDGYDFEVYLSIPYDNNSLQTDFVINVYEDSRGLFWVATSNGLHLYDRVRKTFSLWNFGESYEYFKDFRTNFIFEDKDNNLWISFPGNGIIKLDAKTLSPLVFNSTNSEFGRHTVNYIFQDRHGNLWFGTEGNGIYVLNPNTNKTTHYSHDQANSTSLSNNIILTICENAEKSILVGTLGGGINVFNEKTQTFSVLKTNFSNMDNLVFSLLLDKNSTIWAGTDGAGIFQICPSGTIKPYWENISPSLDMKRAKVHYLFQDKQGNIWVALYQKGVLCISVSGSFFQNIGFNPFDVSKNLGTHCIISILEDSQGNIWAGTDGDGLYKIDNSGKKHHFKSDITPGFVGNSITALFEDKDKNIWIGTYRYGCLKYNTKTEKFESYCAHNNLKQCHITSFAQDKEDNLWIGSMGVGVFEINSKKNLSKQYYDYGDGINNQISSNWVFDIIVDKDNDIWAATSNGLNKFNKKTDKFEEFILRKNNRVISNLVYTLLEDHKGNIWIGGYYGLHLLEKSTGKTSLITTLDGLPDNMIAGIQEDKENNLWISTGKGLCKYNPETKEFLSFFADDGITSNEFRRGSHFKGKEDKMYFGGINGITTFYPSNVSLDNELLALYFRNFLVNNKPVIVGQSYILKKSLDETEKIRLKFEDRNFTFQFSALEFGMPKRVNYFIKMENFDNQWYPISNSVRSVSYTNINPGNYVFKVKATIDGIHVLEREMHIVILHPWWLSSVAKILYGILSILLAYAIYKYLAYRRKERYHKQLELIVEQRTRELILSKEKAEESDRLKTAFLANMSHEIRTPLHGIIGFIQFLSANDLSHEDKSQYINIINNSSAQLLNIIDDIIDISKIEAQQITLSPIPVNLNELMNELHLFFKNFLTSKNKTDVELILDNKQFIENSIIYADIVRLRQVLNNLISNAIKFTDNGYIRFGYRKANSDTLEFFVEDTGIGLPEDQLEAIFNRFHQADCSQVKTRLYGGNGLGLTISRSLVKLNGGKIWVTSKEGIGSTFYFTIAFLPVFQDEIQIFELTEKKQNEYKPFVGKSVLLVEQNFMKFKYYEKLISRTGAIVVKAEDMQQCFEILSQLHKINVVIIDSSLMENEEILEIQNIKNERIKLPVVVIISEDNKKFIHLLNNNSINKIIQAPVKYPDIVKILVNQ